MSAASFIASALPFEEPNHVKAPAPKPTSEPLATRVVRSTRRKKSSQARLVGDVLDIRIPAWFSEAQEAETVEFFAKKFERERNAERIDLQALARRLAAAHNFALPVSIQWVSNQSHQWGSCTPANGSIRLSDRLGAFPEWVIAYVVCHELAHLSEPNHDQRFWDLVNRYPKTERARGFLIAKGMDAQD